MRGKHRVLGADCVIFDRPPLRAWEALAAGSAIPGYTDDLVLAVDCAQREAGEGPCMAALDDAAVLHIGDMEREERWPQFTERARELGVRSMLCCRLRGGHGARAALNLHGKHPHVFDSAAADTVAAFAAHASLVFAQAEKMGSLKTAVSTRQQIGEALGILMERHGVSSDEAFEMLTEVSQRTNTKLRQVAAALAVTRRLPLP